MGAFVNSNLESTYTGAQRLVVRFLPSLTDFAFAVPVLWLFYILTGTITFLSDGDTGWHLRTGDWILKHRAVPTVDLFSFTRPHDDWYAWEWLWDTLFALVHQAGGLGAVAFVNVLLLCLTSVVLFRLIRRTSENDLISLACTALAMFASSIHWLARPHLVSWLFVLAFAHCLLSAKRGKGKALIALPFLMLLWTNLHGGFFLGIIMLLIAAGGEILGAFLHAQIFWQAAWQRSRPYFTCAAACSLATFVNPYGWRLHSHILHYLFDRRLLGQINEFQSVDFHNPLGLLFEIMLMLALPTILWAGMRKQYATLLGLLCWSHLAVYSARNVPIFAFLAAPAIASMLSDVLGRLATARRFGSTPSTIAGFAARMQPLERMGRYYVWSAALVLSLAVAFASALPGFTGMFHSVSFPTSALPVLRTAHISRLFTTDTWASYFVYNLYPSQPSFMDGRSDFFGSDLMETYGHIINARWDWEEKLRTYAIDGVVLRPDAPVVAVLKTSSNWHLLFDDGKVVIFKHAAEQRAGFNVPQKSQVSFVRKDEGKKLGSSQPGLLVTSIHNSSHERRSS